MRKTVLLLAGACLLASGATLAAQGRGKSDHPAKPAVVHQSPAVTTLKPVAHAHATAGPKTRVHADRATGPTVAVAHSKPRSTPSHVAADFHPAPPSKTVVARVTPLLPAGLDVRTASAGFKNYGQFVAALHVSRNLGIPFTDLKARMVGPHPESLGRAIQDLRPRANSAVEVARAQKQADLDLHLRRRS